MREFLTLLILAASDRWRPFALAPEGRQTLDRVRINAMRADHQARYRAGEPLAGTPDLARLDERLAAQGVKLGDPVMLRLFKLEFTARALGGEGRALRALRHLSASACGRDGLDPSSRKATARRPRASTRSRRSSSIRTAAGTVPSISVSPTSSTKRKGRDGSFIMVHGGCSSIGCYAMTDHGGRRALALRHGGARCGRGTRAGPCLPVPHDRRQSEGAGVGPMGGLLGRSQEGPRPVRADAFAAGRQRMQRALRVFAWECRFDRQRRRAALPARGRLQ